MRLMKNSGIEWIGDIPSDWKTIRMKSCFIQRDGGAWGDEATGGDGDAICLRIADFDYGRFVFKDTVPENLTKRNYTSEVIEKLRLNKDDILIEKSGGGEKTPVGRTVIFDKDYVALFANFMDRLRCADFIYPKYMQYTFVTFYKNQYTRNYIKQTTGIQNLDLTSMLSNETVPFPHYIEQKRIADFLDEKCAEIDTVIEKTKATIEEYKKLKQSVITQAVTKGIRPNRPMKDSGIEWIGEIPADWEIRRIKSLGTYRNGLTYAPDDLTDESLGTLVLRSSNIKNGKLVFGDNVYVSSIIPNNLMVKKGDILICSRNGSRELIGKNAIVEDEIIASFGAFMMIFRTKYPNYIYYILNSDVFKYYLGTFLTATINQLTGKNFGDMEVVFCLDIKEQEEIVEYLNKKCSEIDELIAKKTSLLSELESYKKSLIYEYVTGKKEV